MTSWPQHQMTHTLKTPEAFTTLSSATFPRICARTSSIHHYWQMTGRHFTDSTTQWLQDFCAQCGWSRISTKALHASSNLCLPICMRWWLLPSNFMTQVQDGKIKIQTKHWPSFLYDEGEDDREECDKGLFKGFLLLQVRFTSSYLVVSTIISLLQVYHHIFTSPSSAIGKVRKGKKPSKAQIYSMKWASSHTITYACVQVRFHYLFTPPEAFQTHFLLSNLNSWSTADGHFDLHTFYDNIVTLFKTNPHLPWVVKTLNWWNVYIFPQRLFIDLTLLLVKFCGWKLEVTRRR